MSVEENKNNEENASSKKVNLGIILILIILGIILIFAIGILFNTGHQANDSKEPTITENSEITTSRFVDYQDGYLITEDRTLVFKVFESSIGLMPQKSFEYIDIYIRFYNSDNHIVKTIDKRFLDVPARNQISYSFSQDLSFTELLAVKKAEIYKIVYKLA